MAPVVINASGGMDFLDFTSYHSNYFVTCTIYFWSMKQFHIEKDIPADPETIWQILTDFEQGDDPDTRVEILEPGNPDHHYQGLVRKVTTGRDSVTEKMLLIKPTESIEYQLLSGAPVHDYYGTIFLYPGRKFTTVRWVVTFRSNFPWPEWLIKKIAMNKIHKVLDGIAEKATGVPA